MSWLKRDIKVVKNRTRDLRRGEKDNKNVGEGYKPGVT